MKRKNLVAAREKRGLTQAELAKKVGLAEITVRTYENGKRNPSAKAAMALSNYFELKIEYLFPDIFLPKFDTKSIKHDKQPAK